MASPLDPVVPGASSAGGPRVVVLPTVSRSDPAVSPFDPSTGEPGTGEPSAREPLVAPAFAGRVRADWEAYRNARRSSGVDQRLYECWLRRQGRYTETELAAIQRVGVKPVYAQITPAKCLLATSLLAGLYLGPERPWRIEPTPEPDLPETGPGAEVTRALASALADEIQARQMFSPASAPAATLSAGASAPGGAQPGSSPFAAATPSAGPLDMDQIMSRARELAQIADRALQQKAWKEARRMTAAVDDVLVEGRFYEALAEFLHDFTTYPYAVIRGPVVRSVVVPDWAPDGTPVTVRVQRLTWERVDPSLVWWTPGSSTPHDAVFIEKMPFLATDLEAFVGVPGFDDTNLRIVIERYGASGWKLDHRTSPIPSRAEPGPLSRGSDPNRDTTSGPIGYIDVLAWSGRISGAELMRYGDIVLREPVDPGVTYFVQAWIVNDLIIYLDITSDPLATPVYAVASWDWQPGSLVGRALPETLSDVQDAANAVLRALVSNVAVASGPQVVVDVDRIAAQDPTPRLSPWKVWQVTTDPVAGNSVPVTFFQPPMNAGELLTIYRQLIEMADEVSGLPRYMAGSGKIGTLGRTASGIAMMMERAGQLLRTLAITIDRNVIQPNVERVFHWVRQQRRDLTGDARVVVLGATKLGDDDEKRRKVLELLLATSNPVDLQLLGLEGRLGLLQSLARSIGLPEELLVPTVEQLAKAKAMADAGAIGPSGSPPAPPSPPSAEPPGPAPAGSSVET